jgi:hypothetical protein
MAAAAFGMRQWVAHEVNTATPPSDVQYYGDSDLKS